MAVPRQRTSKSRKRKRRTHHRLSAPTTCLCSQCKQPKEPHRVCPHCGYYRGRLVEVVEELG